ncbi:unnamed protein product [Effrenium voratum]|nr:unnamed protein product [Effrenium voratum]
MHSSESAVFVERSGEWQWELLRRTQREMLNLDASNLTNGTTYMLCTAAWLDPDLDGLDYGHLHSGFSGLFVPVTPLTHISEESIQAAANQQVLFVCHGCLEIEHYCDTLVGCPATASPGKEGPGYNTEVIFDASSALIGYRYRSLASNPRGICMDLDGSSTNFNFHDTGFSVYITPVSVVRHRVLIIGAPSSRLEFSCHSTGTVASSCSTSSAVYLGVSCDLNRDIGILADWEIQTSDHTPTEVLTAIPGAEGSIYEFRVDLNTSHLQVGQTYRLCIDTDAQGGLYFGDSGFEVAISGVEAINPSDSLAIGSATVLDIYCPEKCGASTTAYLAQESLGCDGATGGGGVQAADGIHGTASANLAAAAVLPTWQAASPFLRDWTVTLDTTGLKAGESYLLCVDFDGAGTTVGFANAFDGVLKTNPIVPEYTALAASSVATLPLTCDTCNQSTIVYLATACDVESVVGGMRENCLVSYWTLVPPQTCSVLLEANFPANSGFVRLSPRTDLPGSRWTAELDTSGLSVGTNYRLCADLDGGFTEQGFLDVGQVMITGLHQAQRSISTAATRHEWSGGEKQALVFTCDSADCTAGTTLVYLGTSCDTSSDSSPLKVAEQGEQTASAALEALSGWSAELLPERSVPVFARDGSATYVYYDGSSDFIAMIDTSGLTPGIFYKLCVDHDGGGNWYVGDTGLRVLATDLSVAKSVHRGLHQKLAVNCTQGCSSDLVALLSRSCDEVTLASGSGGTFANQVEGTAPAPLTRFGGPRIFSGFDSDNTTTLDTPGVTTGDTYLLYLDTTVLQLGQTYALCVDFDGAGAMELGDAGRRVYVTGVYGFAEHGVIKKATGQIVELRCNPGECSSAMRVYLGVSCDFTVMDGTSTAVAGQQTDAVDLYVAGLDEDADDRGGLLASATAALEVVLETAPLQQVPVACGDCSTSSSAFLSISCDVAILPELNHSDGTQQELVGFTTGSANLFGTAPNFKAIVDASNLKPGALYTLCLDKDGTGSAFVFAAFGQVQVSSPVPHRFGFTVDGSQLTIGRHYQVCLDADGTSTGLGWGDTGLQVYVTGVTYVSPATLTRGSTSRLWTSPARVARAPPRQPLSSAAPGGLRPISPRGATPRCTTASSTWTGYCPPLGRA